jgi:sirohydrochlorin ferrochelatase
MDAPHPCPAAPGRIGLLVDNGSLQPAATLRLRAIAAALATASGWRIDPVSLWHSDRAPADRLEGRPAELAEAAIRARHAAGTREFVVVPLFFGPSGALTGYLPGRIEHLCRDLVGLRARLAAPVVDPADAHDRRLARLLADHVREAAPTAGEARPVVVLADHGSPQRAVAQVRDHVAAQLRTELGETVRTVVAASMERRPGEAFAFNEPLLERALAQAPCGAGAGTVVVAPLFFSAGRHAGPGGDIERICRAAESAHPGLRVVVARLVGEHPGLVAILADRLAAAARRA